MDNRTLAAGYINRKLYPDSQWSHSHWVSHKRIDCQHLKQAKGADPGGVHGVRTPAPLIRCPCLEKNIFSKRAPIRRILGFWRSKVPQNGRFHAKVGHEPSCKIWRRPVGEMRNRTKWQIYKQTNKQTVIDISTLPISMCGNDNQRLKLNKNSVGQHQLRILTQIDP